MRRMELGDSPTLLRRKLVAAVLRGEKTATASLREEYAPYSDEALPKAGERFVLAGYDDEPVGTVEVTQVKIVPVAQIDLQFARDEGEGFESVAHWREAHERFWAGVTITDDTLVVCERFTLL